MRLGAKGGGREPVSDWSKNSMVIKPNLIGAMIAAFHGHFADATKRS